MARVQEQDEQRADDAEGARRGRHSRPRTSPGRRRRWPLLVAGTAVLSALLAPAQPETIPAAQAEDTGADWSDVSAAAIRALSAGAPAGAVTLPVAPAQSAQPEPATPAATSGLAANGIPNVALNAYRVAAARMANAQPSCGIDWSLLAGIGRVESNHGRFAGAALNADGTSTPAIVGPALDGGRFAYIGDSDGGRFDGDSRFDRAVGPMQFIPATWRSYAVDADGDGTSNPLDIDDAALAAAHYLCVAGGDLRTAAGQRRAVLAYNHSDSYVAQVLALAAAYAAGIPVADLPPLVGNTTGGIPAPSGYWAAPAAPGPAIGASDATTSSGDTTYSRNIAPATASSDGSSPNGGTAAAPAASGGTPGGSGG